MSESNLEKPISTLNYRGPVKRTFFAVIALSLLSLIVIYRLRADEIGGQDWYWGLLTLIFAASLPITLLFRALVTFRPKIFCSYDVYKDRMVRRWGKTEHVIRYADLTSVSFSRFYPRFTGGFAIKAKSGVELRFPSLVENNSDLVKAISEARPDLLESSRKDRFLVLSEALDVSWGRSLEKIKNFKFWIPKYLVWPFVLPLLLYQEALDYMTWLFIVAGYSFLLAFSLNLLEERLWLAQVAQDGSVRRSKSFETKLGWAIDIAYYALTLSVTYTISRFFT